MSKILAVAVLALSVAACATPGQNKEIPALLDDIQFADDTLDISGLEGGGDIVVGGGVIRTIIRRPGARLPVAPLLRAELRPHVDNGQVVVANQTVEHLFVPEGLLVVDGNEVLLVIDAVIVAPGARETIPATAVNLDWCDAEDLHGRGPMFADWLLRLRARRNVDAIQVEVTRTRTFERGEAFLRMVEDECDRIMQSANKDAVGFACIDNKRTLAFDVFEAPGLAAQINRAALRGLVAGVLCGDLQRRSDAWEERVISVTTLTAIENVSLGEVISKVCSRRTCPVRLSAEVDPTAVLEGSWEVTAEARAQLLHDIAVAAHGEYVIQGDWLTLVSKESAQFAPHQSVFWNSWADAAGWSPVPPSQQDELAAEVANARTKQLTEGQLADLGKRVAKECTRRLTSLFQKRGFGVTSYSVAEWDAPALRGVFLLLRATRETGADGPELHTAAILAQLQTVAMKRLTNTTQPNDITCSTVPELCRIPRRTTFYVVRNAWFVVHRTVASQP